MVCPTKCRLRNRVSVKTLTPLIYALNLLLNAGGFWEVFDC